MRATCGVRLDMDQVRDPRSFAEIGSLLAFVLSTLVLAEQANAKLACQLFLVDRDGLGRTSPGRGPDLVPQAAAATAFSCASSNLMRGSSFIVLCRSHWPMLASLQ